MVKATGASNIEATKLVDERRYASIAAKRDFSFETVLSSRCKMDIIQKAKKKAIS